VSCALLPDRTTRYTRHIRKTSFQCSLESPCKVIYPGIRLSYFCKMSIYPQQAYSQPPFPHAYPPQPPSYALPSSPVYPVDPGTFRSDYTARLAGLTDNSRVIIQGLSMYAHDFSRWGDVVTQCIETHIRRVSGSLLSTFYSPRSTHLFE
jgi:hypothetical protein